MINDHSLYIIKPEALKHSLGIHNIIELGGLHIKKIKRCQLTEDIIKEIYFDCSSKVIEATIHFIANQECEVGIVEGVEVILRLLKLCGEDVNPQKCNDGTIRKLYGIGNPSIFNGTLYYKNAIHRPKTLNEVLKDMKILFDFVNT